MDFRSTPPPMPAMHTGLRDMLEGIKHRINNNPHIKREEYQGTISTVNAALSKLQTQGACSPESST